MTSPTPKADRYSNRAPRGGAVSPINGIYYKGGTWMPMASAGFNGGPVVLMGSVRQVAWATRLRNEALAKLARALVNANALLMVASRTEAPAIRAACRKLAIVHHSIKAEKSAARIIEGRANLAA